MPQESYKFLFEAFSTALLGLAVWFLQRISVTNVRITRQVAVLIERSDWHAEEIKHHDGRLTRLEDRRRTK